MWFSVLVCVWLALGLLFPGLILRFSGLSVLLFLDFVFCDFLIL